MKRRLKAVLKGCWGLTGPVRRPLARRAARFVAGSLDAPFAEVHRAILASRHAADATAAETDLLLDSLVRELARLQRQVEALRDEAEAGRGGLALAGEPE